MSVRQKREVLNILIKHFEEFELPAYTTYSGYSSIIPDAVLPRSIRKTYGNWSRAVKALQMARPDLFAPKPVPQPKPAPVVEPVVKEEPKAQVAVKPKPAVKPVKKPTVSTSK